MKELMNFKGTIDGGTYFFRPLIGIVFLLPGFIAIGVEAEQAGALLLVLGFVPALILGLSTTNKRLNALMPDNKILGWVLCFIPYVSWFMSLYLLFANSKIENHNG